MEFRLPKKTAVRPRKSSGPTQIVDGLSPAKIKFAAAVAAALVEIWAAKTEIATPSDGIPFPSIGPQEDSTAGRTAGPGMGGVIWSEH